MHTKKPEYDFFDLTGADLAREWAMQAAHYHDAALDLADAREEYEKAKAARDLTVAELDRDVRHNPDKYGLKKITEPVVEKTIIRQVEFQRAAYKIIEARHTVDVIQAKVDGLEHRKRALENMVQLRLSDFYADPKQPKNPEVRRQLGEEAADRAFGKRRN